MARVNGRHNLEVLETAIEDWLDGSAGLAAAARSRFGARSRRPNLPRPNTNRKLLGIEVDFHWPDLGLVIEIDGPPHKSRPPSRLTDAERDLVLTAAGYRVVRCATTEAALDAIRRAASGLRPRAARGGSTRAPRR